MQRFDTNKLRKMRRARGLSLHQLAHAIGRSFDTVRHYEQPAHRCKPGGLTLTRIAQALDCRVGDLFTEDES